MEVIEGIYAIINSPLATNFLLLFALGSLFRIEKEVSAVRGNTFFLRKD